MQSMLAEDLKAWEQGQGPHEGVISWGAHLGGAPTPSALSLLSPAVALLSSEDH